MNRVRDERSGKEIMKKIQLVIGALMLAALVVFSSGSLAAAPAKDDLSDLDAFITKALAEYKVPGAAVAVVQDGKVVMAKGYGVRDINKPDKVDENTIFQLASVTKSLTGAAVGTVVDEGKLDLDVPISTYLPQFVGYDPYMTRWMTTRDALAMRTGWPAFMGDMIDPFGYDRAQILHQLRYFKPRYSLREVAQYSNMGFFLAGETAAAASGESWNDLVEKRIYAPLEMTRSGTREEGLSDPNMSANHVLVDGKAETTAPSVLDTTGAASSGTSTASDMAKFLLMLLGKGSSNGATVLKPETVQDIMSRNMVGEIEFTEVPPISENTGFYYGLGMDSYDYAGHRVVEKAGALAGVRTIFTLLPDKNTGIVILANLNLTVFPEAVRAYWLNQQLGIDPQTDQDKILDLNSKIGELLIPSSAPENPSPFLGTLDSLVGVYENDYYGRCTISLDGEDLSVECGPKNYNATLKHWNNGAFAMQFPGATQGPSIVTFNIGENGIADSFTHEEFGLFTRVPSME